jgi:hypothetical protein
MSVFPPAFVLGSFGGDDAGRFDPCAVITCGTSVFCALGSSGGSSAFLLAGVAEEEAIGIAFDAGARLPDADELLGADDVAAAGTVCGCGAAAFATPGGTAPIAGAGDGKNPPLVGAGAAFARLRARISLIHRSTSAFEAVAAFGIAGGADAVLVDGVDELAAAGGIVVGAAAAGGMMMMGV